jgi:hypothetical protein
MVWAGLFGVGLIIAVWWSSRRRPMSGDDGGYSDGGDSGDGGDGD